MSCVSIDEFKAIIGEHLAQMASALSHIDEVLADTAELAATAVVSLTSALGALTAEKAAEAAVLIAAIGSKIGDFASAGVSKAAELVASLKSGIIGEIATAAVNGAKASYEFIIDKAKEVGSGFSKGFEDISSAISSAVSKLTSGFDDALEVLGNVVLTVGNVALIAVGAAGLAVAAIADYAAQAVANAFCKGMSMIVSSNPEPSA